MIESVAQLNEFRKRFHANSLVELLQISLDEMGEGLSKLTMPIREDIHTNLYNVVHGGALATLADTAMGVACTTTGKKVVTLDMSMNFIRAAGPQEVVRAVGRLVHNGKSTMVAEADIFDGMNNLLFKARGTFFVTGSFQKD